MSDACEGGCPALVQSSRRSSSPTSRGGPRTSAQAAVTRAPQEARLSCLVRGEARICRIQSIRAAVSMALRACGATGATARGQTVVVVRLLRRGSGSAAWDAGKKKRVILHHPSFNLPQFLDVRLSHPPEDPDTSRWHVRASPPRFRFTLLPGPGCVEVSDPSSETVTLWPTGRTLSEPLAARPQPRGCEEVVRRVPLRRPRRPRRRLDHPRRATCMEACDRRHSGGNLLPAAIQEVRPQARRCGRGQASRRRRRACQWLRRLRVSAATKSPTHELRTDHGHSSGRGCSDPATR